jgi:hypothetical protein
MVLDPGALPLTVTSHAFSAKTDALILGTLTRPPSRSGYCPVSTRTVIICDAYEPRIQRAIFSTLELEQDKDANPKP